MEYIQRKMTDAIKHAIYRGKSVLLLGPRQTGKSTLIKKELKTELSYTFIKPEVRQKFERNPGLLSKEIVAKIEQLKLDKPIVLIDEVQKIPAIMDELQDLIDNAVARFILTGSSAKKLKHGANINLLPGRVVLLHLDPLMTSEINQFNPKLENLLIYGSLPGIFTQTSPDDKEIDLNTYVKTYLEEEIRAEALVRNVANFAKFLYLAANESGNLINLSRLSQQIGISHTTISDYYQILEDCLIAERIQPLTISRVRSRLSKASKFLFFDLGVRRLCAEEGSKPSLTSLSKWFEQFVGLELIRHARLKPNQKILYWRDHSGPEVDFVIQRDDMFIPIEVKWNERSKEKDARHLQLFMDEYSNSPHGYIVNQVSTRYKLTKNITVIPWQEINELF